MHINRLCGCNLVLHCTKPLQQKLNTFKRLIITQNFNPLWQDVKYCCSHQTTGICVSTTFLGFKNSVLHTNDSFIYNLQSTVLLPQTSDFFDTTEINFWFQKVNTVPVANLMLGLVWCIHVRWRRWQILMWLPSEWCRSWRSSSWYHLSARTTPPIWYRIWRHQNMYSKSKTLRHITQYLHWCATVLSACSFWYVHLCQL